MTQQLLHVPITHIDANPNNPRHDLGDLTDLIASVTEHGIIEPLIVRPNGTGDTYTIVAGHRRLAAAARTELSSVPVIARTDLDAASAAAVALVENLHRADIDPFDEATGFAQLKGFGWKQSRIATAVGRSPAHVSKRLRLLDLPDVTVGAVRGGHLPIDDAYQLAKAAEASGLDPATVTTELLAMPSFARGSALKNVVADLEWQATCDVFAGEMAANDHILLAEKQGTYRTEPKDPAVKPIATVGVNADAHQTEPCSRFSVTYSYDHETGQRHPAAKWWCAAPDRHLPTGPSDVKVDDAAVQAHTEAELEKASADRRKAERTLRASFISHLFTDPAAQGRIDPDAVVDRAFAVLVDRLESVVAHKACDLLRLEPSDTETWPGYTAKDWFAPLVTALDQDLYRTLLAITLAHGENRSNGSWVAEGSTAVKAHLDYLTGFGFSPPDHLGPIT